MVLFIHPNKGKSSLVFHLVFVGVLSEMIGLNHDLRVLTKLMLLKIKIYGTYILKPVLTKLRKKMKET